MGHSGFDWSAADRILAIIEKGDRAFLIDLDVQ
jgi:hypothetical protein